jgi:thiamine-phosphate pyrophosphorylase
MGQSCRLYLISPPTIDLPKFVEQVKDAFAGGDIGSFQLRLKNASDAEILKAAEALIPICHDHEAAFILNDRADLAVECDADGIHLGQDDLLSFCSPLGGEQARTSAKHEVRAVGGKGAKHTPHDSAHASSAPPQGGSKNNPIAAVRKIVGDKRVIGVSAHASKHLGMVAGEQGADYVAFGAFYPTQSKPKEKLEKWGTPTLEILEWWQAFMVLPCVAIGGMTPANCLPQVKAGADFIAAITYVWNHPKGPGTAVKEFNDVFERAV